MIEDIVPHWSQHFAPVEAPDPFANRHPVSPWLPVDIPFPAQTFW